MRAVTAPIAWGVAGVGIGSWCSGVGVGVGGSKLGNNADAGGGATVPWLVECFTVLKCMEGTSTYYILRESA